MTIKRLIFLVVLAILVIAAIRCIDAFVRDAACLIAHSNETTLKQADQ